MLSIGITQAQNYEFITNADPEVSEGHGIAVDPDGKIWYAAFSDSGGIRVLNPDLTPADFSPITEVTIGGETFPTYSFCRGMNVDHEGNIIAVMQNEELYRINYKDGTGMNHVNLTEAVGDTVAYSTRPAVDATGRIYFTKVTPGSSEDPPYDTPIWILNPDFTNSGLSVTDTTNATWWSRCLEVTPDGNNLYMGLIFAEGEGRMNLHWSSTDGTNYELDESLPQTPDLWGGALDAMAWDREGRLAVGDKGWGCVWIYDFTDEAYDKLVFGYNEPGEIVYPRGIGFSVSNDTVYVLDAHAGLGGLKVYKRITVGIEENVNGTLPSEFSLSQNYPNPFNPETKINFAVVETNFVTIKVYNLLGQEVSTLVSEELQAGNYSINFKAKQLSSGTYIYELRSSNMILTKKMILLK